MAKRSAAVAAVMALAALVVSIISPAGADTRYSHVRFSVKEKAADDVDKFIDVGPQGVSYGDYNVIGPDPLYNPSLSKRVGSVNGDCLVTVATQRRALLECDATFTIRGAHIIVEGPFDFAREGRQSPSPAAQARTGPLTALCTWFKPVLG